MDSQLDEQISIELPKGTLLLLFEFLARSYDSWRSTSQNDDPTTYLLQKPDTGERVALWHLEGQIEKTLPEVFSPEYKQLVSLWKERLTSS